MKKYMADNGTKSSPALFYDFGHAKSLIRKRTPQETAEAANVQFDGNEFSFESLGQKISVSYPGLNVAFKETGEMPVLEWAMSILHYLGFSDGTPLSGEFVAFRDYEKHVAHPAQFEAITAQDLKPLTNRTIEELKEICGVFGGQILKSGADLFAVFFFAPSFPIYLSIYLADEEMEGSGYFLFDKRGRHHLPSIDANILGEMFSSFLAKECASLPK